MPDGRGRTGTAGQSWSFPVSHCLSFVYFFLSSNCDLSPPTKVEAQWRRRKDKLSPEVLASEGFLLC